MSIFNKRMKKKLTSEIVSSSVEERILCKNSHEWNGVSPTVDPSIISVQNEQLIGKKCDCGSFTYNETKCGCSIERWEIELT